MIKSDKLNCKVDDISEVVEDFKCAFETLEEDVHVLETAKNLLNVQQTEAAADAEAQMDATTDQLEAIQETVEGKKETAEAVLEFSHPCGGHDWRQVIYMDFREDDTNCPSGFTANMYTARPHTCVLTAAVSGGQCVDTPFTLTEPYSSVCGRIDAYQFGSHTAFAGAVGGSGINEAYLSGVSLTRGGDLGNPGGTAATHIWSFAAGLTQSITSADPDSRCPCDTGTASPTFVGEDYFCEASSTLAIGTDVPSNANDIIFFPGNLLWDGLGCATAETSSCCNSDCCSRIDHPYFVKHLGVPTMDPIDLRLCFSQGSATENFAFEHVELYVQ